MHTFLILDENFNLSGNKFEKFIVGSFIAQYKFIIFYLQTTTVSKIVHHIYFYFLLVGVYKLENWQKFVIIVIKIMKKSAK